MASFLVYDLEIIKAIPPADTDERLPGIEYCDGWHDHASMGISVVAIALLDTDQEGPCTAETFDNIEDFDQALGEYPNVPLCGFNSIRFDDRLLMANGLQVTTDFDILRLVIAAAGIDPDEKYQERGLSYSMEKICAANDLKKTFSGALAPVLWQQGYRQQVVDHCVEDVILECEILRRLANGTLIDPSDRKLLKWKR